MNEPDRLFDRDDVSGEVDIDVIKRRQGGCFPEPVGPVTRTSPPRNLPNSFATVGMPSLPAWRSWSELNERRPYTHSIALKI
jgi:hypothetical protein